MEQSNGQRNTRSLFVRRNCHACAMKRFLPLLGALALALNPAAQTAEPIKVLLIDGQNNHDWKTTSPLLKAILEETKLFAVEVATAPPAGKDMSGFKPDFAAHGVVVSNYNGDLWAPATQEAFEKLSLIHI